VLSAVFNQLTTADNAYVSGLKEDLGLGGNDLVQLQTFYIVGAVVGQIPFMFLFTYIPMYWTIPFLDIMWGVFTLLQYRTTSFAELAAYRFLVGWFEAAFFPAMHYVFGTSPNLAKPSNISRIVVPRPRNRSSGWGFLHRALPRYSNGGPYSSRCLQKTGRRTWTRGLALDVHHLRSDHDPGRHSGLFHAPRYR
jgi:hypothetical protein